MEELALEVKLKKHQEALVLPKEIIDSAKSSSKRISTTALFTLTKDI
jgi:hypothetical protein